MSSTLISVGELYDLLGDLPRNMLVTTVSPFEPDKSEGLVDGPEKPWVVWAHEVRTGWNPIPPGETCPLCGCPDADDTSHARIVVLSDCPSGVLLEDWDDD